MAQTTEQRRAWKKQWKENNPESYRASLDREAARRRQRTIELRAIREAAAAAGTKPHPRDGHLAHKPPKPGSIQDMVLTILRRCAVRSSAPPTNDELAVMVGLEKEKVHGALYKSVEAGRASIEQDGANRRFVFPDGHATAVGRRYNQEAAAEKQAAVLRIKKPLLPRKCLACGKVFESALPVAIRRICPVCTDGIHRDGDNGFDVGVAAW